MNAYTNLNTLPAPVVNLFFAIGLLSALAFRALILLQNADPTIIRIVWYTGAIGYLTFFIYRYTITKKRREISRKHRLMEKIEENKLDPEDRQALHYIVQSLNKSKEIYNYLAVALLSIAAIGLDLTLNQI
ncbi:MAG: hypothetical protein GF416_06625 [Candidatus Altiarchaeales archaeon]|nr:hypothetical protein [Candidatus Altiarchaeales archaeon]MBD3416789.1 hypothetical protein [Candidatus Altiarchaeales archaeon]